MPQLSIYLVEDHPLMQELLREFIEEVSEHSIVGTASSAEAALRDIEHRKVDCFLIDVSLPDMTGLDLLDRIRTRNADALCIMLTGHREADYARRAFDKGANGFVLKGNPRELTEAIDQVLDGHRYVSEPLRAELR